MFLISLTAVFEFFVHAVPAGYTRWRSVTSAVALAVLIGSTAGLLVYETSLFSVALAAISVYRALNLARIIKQRMHPVYLWHVSYRTSLWLLAAQFAAIGTWLLSEQAYGTAYTVLSGLLLAQMVLTATFLGSTLRHARRMRTALRFEAVHDKDLPSLTVAIPARNETDQLYGCITSVLASNYPKLEILILDDCSQTPHTPELIRKFAHDGVRFIRGEEPGDTWLAKNQAYDTLAKAASGELILYAGVDIRFEPQSLRRIVGYSLLKRKSMLSFMPHNVVYHNKRSLIQPMRYVWELAIPRRLLRKPPVLSSCWFITRKVLAETGGFKAARRMITPEAYFANRLLGTDGYGFLASGTTFGITSVKDIYQQRDTAVRVSYPQLHKRPEAAALVTFGFVVFMAAPFTALLTSIFTSSFGLPVLLAAAIIACSLWMYAVVLRLAYATADPVYICSLPLAAIVYIALLNYSMYKYEFSTVIWKGRNICLPVMHVVAHLPRT